MKNYFYSISDYISEKLHPGENYLLNFSGEISDFSRLNQCKIRQAGNVSQNYLKLSLINNQKISSHEFMVSGDKDTDQPLVASILNALRDRLRILPEDPYLLYAQTIKSSEQIGENQVPDSADVMDDIISQGKGNDLVGIYASGKILKGFSNALGQRNWFEKYNFNFDWSLYYKEDKAVKQSYAGFQWNPRRFKEKIEQGRDALEIMTRPAKTIDPGKYRVYLAPGALVEFIEMLNWGGFGLKSQKTKDTPLIKMIEEDRKLNNGVSMFENTKDGIAPAFDDFGFIKPDKVPLISQGTYHQALVSPRSAKEYGTDTNGANAHESAESFEMQPGQIENRAILKTLDTGVYINNAWYLNYSDRNNCRVTGMTRFASFWVENGEIQSPLNVMRFDESMLRMFGQNLMGLTKDRDFIMSGDTYHQRSTQSAHLPGAMIKDFSFTL